MKTEILLLPNSRPFTSYDFEPAVIAGQIVALALPPTWGGLESFQTLKQSADQATEIVTGIPPWPYRCPSEVSLMARGFENNVALRQSPRQPRPCVGRQALFLGTCATTRYASAGFAAPT